MLRRLCLWLALMGLAACAAPGGDGAPRPDLGDFRLGHNIVVAPNLVQGPFSRKASAEEWIAVMKTAVDRRFGGHEGDRLYHLGISVDGYVLALPGVPVVAAPKSVLIVQATLWDDARARKLNPKPKRFTVLEEFSSDTVVGSGHTRTRDEQMETLARNAARQIEVWLAAQKRDAGWFTPRMAAPAKKSAPETAAPSPDAASAGAPVPAPAPAPAPAKTPIDG